MVKPRLRFLVKESAPKNSEKVLQVTLTSSEPFDFARIEVPSV